MAEKVIFLCQRGGAKSVIAASLFNREMEARGDSRRAIALAAEEAYDAVPQPVADYLAAEGFDLEGFRPRQATTDDLQEASAVVVIGCDVSVPNAAVQRWDEIPNVGDGLDESVRAIRERVEKFAASSPPTLAAFAGYFLRLGTIGFGGPIALAGAMQRDLVEERRWVSEDEYVKGLALAQLAPGPLAAQLAIYLGWCRGGILGATLVAFAFVLPSFAMVLAISMAYVEFGGLPWMQSAFYGIGAAVIAIILRSALKLIRLTLSRDRLLWLVFALNAVATAALRAEVITLIVAGGVVVWLARTRIHTAPAVAAEPALLSTIFWFFTKAGAFIFGSGLAIVPFLYGGVVREHRWLDEQQFLDAVAVAMITPGPVVITVAFIGYLVAGHAGAITAAIAVFLPCYLLVIIPAPYYSRFADNAHLRAFVAGVTAATTGAIAGAVFVLGSNAIVDLTTALIFGATLAALIWLKRMPEPLLIVAVAAAAILLRA